MHITLQTPTQLVIQTKRGGMVLVMTAFLGFSILTVIMILGYGLQMLTTNFAWWRLLGYLIWQPLSIALVAVAVMFWNNAMRGLRLTFDRTTETVTLYKPRFVRMQTREFSIYSISRLEIEPDPLGRVFAVYLVTKSGEHIPIASASIFEEEALRELVSVVRRFVQQ